MVRNFPDNNKWLLVGNDTIHYALKQNYGDCMHIKISYDWQPWYYFVYIRFKERSNPSLFFIYGKKCVTFLWKGLSIYKFIFITSPIGFDMALTNVEAKLKHCWDNVIPTLKQRRKDNLQPWKTRWIKVV